MKRLAAIMIAGSLALSALCAPAIAKTTKPTKMASAATIKCPACGMPMPTKKNAMMTVPVKIKGKTYYCCPMCPAGKSAAAKMHSKKTM